MFPCHTDHHNAGCDKSYNNLPAMLCYSWRSGFWKNRISPFVWVGVVLCCTKILIFLICLIMCFVAVFTHISSGLCWWVVILHVSFLLHPVFCGRWKVGQKVIRVKHGMPTGASRGHKRIQRQSTNSFLLTSI